MKSLGYKDLLERETRSLSAGGLWAPKYIRDPVKRLLTRIEAVQVRSIADSTIAPESDRPISSAPYQSAHDRDHSNVPYLRERRPYGTTRSRQSVTGKPSCGCGYLVIVMRALIAMVCYYRMLCAVSASIRKVCR